MASDSIRKIFYLAVAAILCVTSCGKDDTDPDTPGQNEEDVITDIRNSYENDLVSYRGETVSVRFNISVSWTASLVFKTSADEEWASISSATQSGQAKNNCAIRVVFEENEIVEERTVELWVEPEGHDSQCIATLTQAAAGASADARINAALNTYMHDILKEDYLFKDSYNAQEIDLTMDYGVFLAAHLLNLGEKTIADGGYYRTSHPEAGNRYIYTNLVEIQPISKVVQTGGLGFGPFLSTSLPDNPSLMGLAASYVRRGSPAEAIGLRRGDVIFAVNGTQLTTSNYRNFMTSLYQNPSGAYQFSFLRFEENGQGGYALNAYDTEVANASAHIYDPVLHASVLNDPDDASVKIGYLVYESFDLGSQELLAETIEEFASAGITDLILDLRFNAGGAVAQSRWLSGCIAGEANGSKTFTKVVYNNGAEENWTFDYGYTSDTDNLGKPVDLGLDRLYVICSYNTASAAELVISSLKGIDFPVKMIGCRTEGKNVGMTVSETSYDGRRFQFSPVTFWVRNAKGWGDYADGIVPDEYVNNDNTITTDDADNVFPYSFSDWGNMDYNIALQWAYCDITGKTRWTHTPSGAASARTSGLSPVDVQPLALHPDRFGNMRYDMDNN